MSKQGGTIILTRSFVCVNLKKTFLCFVDLRKKITFCCTHCFLYTVQINTIQITTRVTLKGFIF